MGNKYTTPAPYFFNYEEGGPKKYLSLEDKIYYSKRYNKYKSLPEGYQSDGATGAIDIISFAWWIHDILCEDGYWNDGTKLTNWQCSMVIYDVLREEKRFLRDSPWLIMTFLFGGGEARKNGMFRLKEHV